MSTDTHKYTARKKPDTSEATDRDNLDAPKSAAKDIRDQDSSQESASATGSTEYDEDATYEITDATDRTEWDDFVTSHPEANFLQSWDYYVFFENRGNQVVRRLAKLNGQIVGAYAGVIEVAKRGRYLAIAGGPILDWDDRTLVNLVFDDMGNMGRLHRCAFVRVRPQLELSDQCLELMHQLGLRRAPMYLSVEFAGILDLKKDEEEIMKGMRQRLRRALRKGMKNNIQIEKSTNSKDIHEFYQIELQTAGRHRFVAFSEDYLTKQFAAFAPHGEAILYTAKYEGEILAQNFMIFYGNEASYHYGVSSELGTKYSGAPLLHMEAMRDARKRGIERYNFWGITEETEIHHRFYGVSQFKRGFGVDELKYIPAHDLVLNKFKYTLDWIVETLRKRIRHV